MKNNLLRCCTYAIATLVMSGGILKAQIWKDPMSNSHANFYTIQNQFNHDMGWLERRVTHETVNQPNSTQTFKGGNSSQEEESESGMESYLQYKRWEYFMEPRVFPSGDLSLPSTTWQRFEDYLNSNAAAMQQYQQGQGNYSAQHNSGPVSIQSNVWTFAGPTGAPTGGGAGRVGFVRVDPTNSNILWIGAPAGGLWKSTNGGTSWTTNTDFLTVIGASDVVIDPTNTQNMYLATGDGDAGDTYSIGVLKSTDGGTTWNTTGLTWTPNQGRLIRKLLIDPNTPTTVMAFSNVGIWRTTNGGTSWTQVQNTNGFTDAEYMPGTPATVYACGTTFWRSTNGGATWTQVTTGLPANTAVDRMAIAVTAANSAYIYLIAGSATTDGFYGFYKSTNSGTSFAQVTVTSPANLLGWASNGNDAAAGGQGWYDLVIDCSPSNANEVCVGGVNVWRTTNGGTTWTLNAHWTGTGAPYVHADHHAMMYLNATTMFEGCDGGIFKTTNNGGAWTDISSNLCIAQSYRIGLSASNPNYWITGHQDNGTNLKNGAAYVGTMGGDGMDCFVDRTNNNVMYGEQYQGSLNRTTNGGTSWTGITTGLSGTAPWVTPWYQDPTAANTIYCGRTLLFKSTNQGTSWAGTTGALPGAGTVVDFKIAPSNNQVIYVVKSNAVYKTVNGGGAWTTITGTLPVGSATITRVDVKPTDPLVAIVTFSGYSSGNKVFKTTNGGTSWTNISAGLPNLPVNCVRFDPTSGIEGVYVGCDVGIYYTDNTFAGTWQPYFTSLPNVPIFDLEVYAPTLKLRASSYGRGIWETDVYNPGTLPPIAQFIASSYITCVGSPVNFTDQSSFSPTSWSWTFPSGVPATSTTQNPSGVTWATPGTYTVSLTCTNSNGTSSPATRVITVLASQAPPLVEGFEAATFLPVGWTANNINNDAMFWTQATTGSASAKSAVFDNYNNDVGGAQDEMWAPRLNCGAFSTLSMTFDVAYAPYDLVTYTDTLQVLVSTDCGSTWNSVYLKGGATLGTAGAQTASIFIPTAGQWRNENVVLNAYAGQSSVLIIFRNRGHYGQAIYVDNINITGTASAIPNGTFTASTTSACVGAPIAFTDASSGTPTSWTWTFPGGAPASATTQNVAAVTWAAAGTYTVTHTATNASGTGTTTQVITINALPNITTTTTGGTICSGSNTTMTASGGVSYTWMPGSLSGTTVTVSPLTTTTYTVTGTNASGCTNTATRTITVNPTPTVSVSATSTTICNGSSTTLSASGATTYTWMPGSLSGTSVTVSPVISTTYTVTGTSLGCTATATQLITVNPSPVVTVSATSTTICNGSSTTLTASGATTYTWMPGSLAGTSVTVSPVTSTTYTVTGTSSGCTGSASQLITVNPSPTVTVSATSTTICSGSSTTLTASGATTYTWMPGSLSGTSVTVSPVTTTTYTVTGTSAGCTANATRLITVNPTPTVSVSATSTTICSGSSTTLTANGATTYTWMPGSLSGTSVTVSPVTTTTYTVTGTSGSCAGTQTQLISVNSTPTVTVSATSTTICNGSSTTLTASGATTYTWMPGSLSGNSITVSPTITTTYTVTGTNSGCSATATQLITVTPSPTVTISATSTTICVGNSTTLTASGATTYSWMPGSLSGTSISVSPVTSTTYTVTGTTGGCAGTQTQLITVTPTPTVTVSATSTTICNGSSTTLTASGATTYTWMPGSLSGNSITVSPAGTTTYTVTGTTTGCVATATQLITVNPSPTVTVSAAPAIICSGNSTTLTANGATTYTWMPGSLSGNSVTDLPGTTTTYTVTGTAANGCTDAATQLITVNATPTVTASSSSSSICTGNSVTLTGSGATTYLWMPGSLSGAVVSTTPASTTTYTVTGTSGSCNNTATVTVIVGAPPTISVSATSTSICTGSSTTLTGSGGATYTWMPGSLSGTSITVSPVVNTTYTVTGSSGPGCTNTATITISVNALPSITTSTTGGTICSGSSTTITASGGVSYTWMPGSLSGTTITISPATTTTYTVTGTNAAGCTNTSTRTITVNTSPTVTTSTTGSSICLGSNTTITAAGASSYSWMPGSLSGTTITITPAVTTSYTVTGTAVNGCTGTATQLITVTPSPTVTITATSSAICSGTSTTLTGSGATTYTWMPGSLSGTTITVSPSTTTTYTLTGTSGGCTGTATQLITVNPSPTITTTVTPVGAICSGSSKTITASGALTYTWMPGSLSGNPVVVTPPTSTTYTVTGTAANGCTGTTMRTVTVNPSPTVTASASSTSICTGSPVTLSATGATTYNWQPGNHNGQPWTTTPAATTTYTVTGTMGGCTGTSTITVTVNPTPTVTTTTTGNTICAGNSTTITANGAATYSWMPGSLSGTTVTISPATTTTYTVTGSNGGCTGTATRTITVNPSPTVTATISSSSICPGTSVTLTGSGATSYNWQPINSSGSPVTDVPSSSVTYTVTGTGANGCTSSSMVSVTVNPLPSVLASVDNDSVCIGTLINLSATGALTFTWQPMNVTGTTATDSPVTSTTYVVTGTDINGCSNSDSIMEVVYAQPTISVSGNNSICLGSSTTLTASGAATYFWPLGGQSTTIITDSPTTTTTYTVNGTDISGCSGSATYVVTVGIPPAVPTITVNGSVLTSSVTGASYQWFLNGVPIVGATNQSYTATQMGSFTVEVYDAMGCGSGQSAAVIDPTGIATATDIDVFSVIPNPNDGHFQLNFHVTKTDNYILEIHNALGQIIYKEELSNFRGTYNKDIDLSIYERGMYSIRLRNSTNEIIIKTLTY